MKIGTGGGKGPYHIQADINMIPLIDVSLVLLIIFMVISPLLVESQLKVNLPKISTGGKTDETALKVEVDSQGRYGFNGQQVTFEELKMKLKRELPPGHRASLLIEADKSVAFQNVIQVMDLAKQMKVDKLGVAVIPESTSK